MAKPGKKNNNKSGSNSPVVASKDGIAAPRPLRTETELGRILIALEAKDCDCPLSRLCLSPADCPGKSRCDECPPVLDLDNPCPHLAAVEHRLPIEDWLSLLHLYDADGYADRPRSLTPGVAVSREARLALYERRARSGEALFHPDDIHADDLDAIAIQAGKGLVELGLRATRQQEEKKESQQPKRRIRLYGGDDDEKGVN